MLQLVHVKPIDREDTYKVPDQGAADYRIRDRGKNKPCDDDPFDPLEVDDFLHYTIPDTGSKTAYWDDGMSYSLI